MFCVKELFTIGVVCISHQYVMKPDEAFIRARAMWLAAALPYLIPATLGFLLVGFGIYFCAFIHHDNLMQLCVLDGRSYHFAFYP